jgi:hypothetical protein
VQILLLIETIFSYGMSVLNGIANNRRLQMRKLDIAIGLSLGMLAAPPVLANTVYINFNTFPGPDCQLGTDDDIETVHGESVADQYYCVGAVFSLTDGSAPTITQYEDDSTYSDFTRSLYPANDVDGGGPDLQDIVIDFTVPTSRVKLSSLDTEEAVTLRAFNAEGTQIASDYQAISGNTAVENLEVQVDGSQGFITKVVVDLTQSNAECCWP